MRLGRHCWALVAVALAALCAQWQPADAAHPKNTTATTSTTSGAVTTPGAAAANGTGQTDGLSPSTEGGTASTGNTTTSGTTTTSSTSTTSTSTSATSAGASSRSTSTSSSSSTGKTTTHKQRPKPTPSPKPRTENKCLQCEWEAERECVRSAEEDKMVACAKDFCTAAWLDVSGTREFAAGCGMGALADRLIEEGGVDQELLHDDVALSCPGRANDTTELPKADDTKKKTVAMLKCCAPLVYKDGQRQEQEPACDVAAVLDAKPGGNGAAAAVDIGRLPVALAAAAAVLLALAAM